MADVTSTLVSWSNTSANNAPAGTTTIGTGLDENLREIQGVVVRGLSHKGADIASASSTDLGAIEGLMHDITGTTTITGFGTVRAGIWKVVKFEGALTLTHNATSLILPGAQNITTVNGDVGIFISEGSGNWRCLSYLPTSNATPSPLTSGRVPYATTGGRLTDAANLTFDGTTLTANTLTVSAGGAAITGASSITDTNPLKLKRSAGDTLWFQPQGAGSGVIVYSVNAAESDYEPIQLRAESIELHYRTGALASAAGITLASTGVVTLVDDLVVNGDSITTDDTTFNIINATATTVNFAGAATTLAIGAATSDTTWTGQSFTLTGANSTDNTVLAVTNTSNAAAASHSYVDVSVGGSTSTGDPHIRFTIPSGTSWYIGPDNTDSDTLKIGTGAVVGTNPILQLSSTLAYSNVNFETAGTLRVDHATTASFIDAGLRIGSDASGNEISDASTGAGTVTLYIGNASINVTSDERVKAEIREWGGNASALLRSLPVKEFGYSSNAPMGGYDGKYVGFTAQDIHAIAPWAVNTQGDTGLPWQARYEFLNGLIVKGWQEHESRIAALEARL